MKGLIYKDIQLFFRGVDKKVLCIAAVAIVLPSSWEWSWWCPCSSWSNFSRMGPVWQPCLTHWPVWRHWPVVLPPLSLPSLISSVSKATKKLALEVFLPALSSKKEVPGGTSFSYKILSAADRFSP